MVQDPASCPRLDVTSLYKHEFWYSHYGFEPRYKDILHITSLEPELDYGISLVMGGSEPAHHSDLESIAEKFDLGAKELTTQERIIFTSQFDPKPLEFKEMWVQFPGCDGYTSRRPFPPRFAACHPARYETYDVVRQVVQQFARTYCKIPFVQIWMGEIPAQDEVCKAYQAKVQKQRAGSKELRISASPPSLLFEPAGIDRHPDIKCGVFSDGQLYAELKDGSRHPVGEPHLKLIK